MSQQPLVSIILITLDTPSLTRACLRSVVKNTSVPHELIVINNSRSSRIRRCLARFPGIRLIQNDRNVGFARAANQGAYVSRGEYLCFLNSDTLVPPGWLERLVQAAQRPGVGAVGPTSQHIHNFIWNWPPPNLPANEPTTALADAWLQRIGGNRLESTGFLYGFCLLIPKAVMARVGLFDEGFFFGVEDVDYSLRLRLAGYRLIRHRSVFVHHQRSGSSHPARRDRLVQQAQRHFVLKWTTPWNGEPRECVPLIRMLDRRIPVPKLLPPPNSSEAIASVHRRAPRLLLRTGFALRLGRKEALARFRDLDAFSLADPASAIWDSLQGLPTAPARPLLDRLLRRKLVRWVRPAEVAEPLVTVMMAAHNAERWIAHAIESVLAQCFQRFELIIADDGSGDRTASVARRYLRHPQVRLIRNPRQIGIAATRNRILRQARGRYIAVCDADDMMLPSLLERFVPILERELELAWIYADRLMISNLNVPIGMARSDPPDGRKEFRENVIAHAGALIRREAILQAGGYDETLTAVEDYDLALKISERCRVACLQGEFHYLWRRHPDRTSGTNPWRIRDTRRLLNRAKRRRRALAAG